MCALLNRAIEYMDMNIARAESGQVSTGARYSLGNLPPAMLLTAASRLCWVALVCACGALAMAGLQRVLQPEVAEVQKQLHIQVNTAIIVLLSLDIFAAGRLGLLPPVSILRLGLVFEVFGGFALATFEYSMPWDSRQPVRGISWMTLWISLCGLLIPNRPLIMVLVALATASMGPIAYMVFHESPIPINRLLIWNFPNYLVGIATVFISRRLYHLEVEVQRAKEMGSYHLESLIGRGGMGEVWRARHRMLARDSAVKLIRPEVLFRATERQAAIVRRRFEQEAKTTAALRSPHTVALYDFGISEDGGFYYVMELMDGIDLETLVQRFGPQPPSRVVHVLRQVCESLAEAHRLGMVHRDIKPTNVFLCRVGIQHDFAKVLDFGLVKTMSAETDTRMTAEGVTTGTPAYMPPEIAMSSEQIDGRADLYGLGCVAYWLLTGHLVFSGKTGTALLLAHVQEAPVPPSQRTERPIPASIDRIVMACLAKRPEDRPATADALARMLESCCEDAGSWTQEEAEQWWRIHLPVSATGQPAGSANATSAPTAALPTF